MSKPAFTLDRLDEQTLPFFLLLMQPGERRRIWEARKNPAQIVLGANLLGQPAGIAIGTVNESTASLSDLYVLPIYRRGGIGGALLAGLEEAAIQSGAEKISVLYRQDDHTPAFGRVLAKGDWQTPTLSHIVFWTTRERDALSLDWVQKYRFRPPYEVVPWPEVTEDERHLIARRGEAGWYPPDLSPFGRPTEAWDAETSLGLRYHGEIVGWVLNVREAPLQLLIEILFVDPPLQRLGKGFMLIGEVTRRCWQIGMQDMYWRAAPDNEPMLRWSRKAFTNVLTDEFEEWYSEKTLGADGRGLRTPDAVKPNRLIIE